jgi:hypothetical protein
VHTDVARIPFHFHREIEHFASILIALVEFG